MFQFSSIPFVRLFTAFSVGILLQDYFLEDFFIPVVVGLLAAGVVLLLWFYSTISSERSIRYLFAIAFLLSIALCGVLRKQSQESTFQVEHLLHNDLPVDFYECVLLEDPIEKTNTWAFVVAVQSISSDEQIFSKRGQVQVYLKKDSIDTAAIQALSYGSTLWVHGSPEEIRPPRNPGGFDFKAYMARKGIYFQDYLTIEDFRINGFDPPNQLIWYATEWKGELLDVLKMYLPNVKERGVAEALILGQKDELDIEQRRAYAAAGAMHILAVSGLHVGIIYMLVAFLLKPLDKRKFGKGLRVVVLFAALWGFAMITGLSASVLRAVTMFSIVIIAESSGRKTNIYNSLALAAFLLLLYNPNFLFSVGYQLSFLAVLGIVYLQPYLYRQWAAPNWLLDKVWSITCVSIAAQLATGPLSMYYFNQFPTWFLLSNLLVIPAAFVILSGGIMLFVLHYLSSLMATWVAFLLKWIVFALNWFVEFIEQLPASQIFPISFSGSQILLLYVSIIMLLMWWSSKKYRWFQYASLVMLLFFVTKWMMLFAKHQKRELVIYEMTGHTAMDYQQGGEIFHYFDEAFTNEERLYNLNIRPHLIQEGILTPLKSHAGLRMAQTSFIQDTLTAIQAGEVKVLHLTKPLPKNRAFSPPLKADILLISNNSLWPGDINRYFSPNEVVFDGTNQFSYLKRMTKALEELENDVYVVPWEGAYKRSFTQVAGSAILEQQ